MRKSQNAAGRESFVFRTFLLALLLSSVCERTSAAAGGASERRQRTLNTHVRQGACRCSK